MFLNNFQRILNIFEKFFLERNDSKREQIKKLLNKRVIFSVKRKTISFLPYKNKNVKKLIWNLKFHQGHKEADFFAEILYQELPEILKDLSLQDNFNNPILITIPLNWFKKFKKGYNQNDLVIKYFMKKGGNQFIKWNRKSLIKMKNTKPQSKIKNRQERLQNVIGSFAVKNQFSIKGKNIIIFDDVMTTGATLNEAKKVLKKAGAKKIYFMTLAH